MVREEFFHVIAERKRTHAHVVSMHTATLQEIKRLAHGAIAAAKRYDANRLRIASFEHCIGYQSLRGRELALQAIKDDLILSGIFGIPTVLRMARTAREVRTL